MALDGDCGDSKGKAVQVVESSDDEDGLWGYGKAADSDEDVQADKEGPISIEDDGDDEGAVLGQKRKLEDDDSDILILDDSDEEEERRKKKRGTAAAVSKKNLPEDDGDDWLDAEAPPSSSRTKASTALDPAIQEMLRKNSEAIESLERASKEVTVTIGDLEEGDDEVVITEEEPQRPAAQGQLSPAPGGSGTAAPDPAVELVEKVQLCVRCNQGKEVQLRMTKTDPFKKLMDTFRKQATEKGWLKGPDAPIKFIFDGDLLQPTSTPAALDCEDGDVIDAHC